MKKKIQLIQSGITLVDNGWGGFYRGGTYLLIGPRKSGRTLLALQYAMECAKQKEVCLFFTSMRPKDLMIHASSIDFDLQYYMNQNLVIVVRVAPPSDLYGVGNPDDFLVEYLNDIVTVVEQYQPNKIVFDELTPFIGFNNINLLQDVFVHTTESIEESGITSLFVLGEPATPLANSVVDALATYSTGIIFLQKKDSEPNTYQGGEMTITPNIGHAEGQIKSNYFIEPYKGIMVDYKPRKTSVSSDKTYTPKKEFKYKSLADIELPKENYSISSIYSLDDFKLILNNQIALYKSTGQVFSVISFKLDILAEQNGILTLNQLQNAIRLSTDKKDKICVLNNKVILLVIRDDQKGFNSLLGKIKANLPSVDPNFLNNVVQYISVYSAKIDENVSTADDIFRQILSEEIPGNKVLGFN